MYIEFDYVHFYLSCEIDDFLREKINAKLYRHEYDSVFQGIPCKHNIEYKHTIINIDDNTYKCIKCNKYCIAYYDNTYHLSLYPMYRVYLI